jgi:uncharacterized protein YkwD
MTLMRRVLPVLCLTAALAGCGSGASEDATTAAAPKAAQAATGTSVPSGVTEGRIGDATTVASDAALDSISKGGKPDPREPKRSKAEQNKIAAGDECPNATLAPAEGNVPAIAAATLCIVNAERRAKGLGALTENAQLAAAAFGHASDMVAKSYFAHDGLDGSSMADRIAATGYLPESGTWALGENLAWGTGSLATPRSIVNSWMNSQGHRENLLNGRYKELGQGIVIGNPGSTNGAGATYAHAFGYRSQPGSAETAAIPGAPAAGTAPAGTTAKIATSTVRRLQRKRCKRFRGRHARACKARVARLARAAAARR